MNLVFKIAVLGFATGAAVVVGLSGMRTLTALADGSTPQAGEAENSKGYSKSGYNTADLPRDQVEELASRLTAEQHRVTQKSGTEPPFCGGLLKNETPGIYACVVCGLPLFQSEHKFKSGTGWPSFHSPFDPDHVTERSDVSFGMARIEILCTRCDAHLGHVFEDGPRPTGRRFCLNSASLKFFEENSELPKESRPVATQTAYFAGGCFWSIEKAFGDHEGVVDAVSGYQNGSVASPTYRQVCSGATGHAETVKVTFDPTAVSYEQLVRFFFTAHDPTTSNRQGPDVGTQYRSGIWTVDEAQAKVAQQVIDDLTKQGSFDQRSIVTQVDTAGEFWPAEEYHQDYLERQGGTCGN